MTSLSTSSSSGTLPAVGSQMTSASVDLRTNSARTVSPSQQGASSGYTRLRYERALSSNELSYYLPSRAYGTNDMHSVLEFYAPISLITPDRLLTAFAIIRLRHVINASRVVMGPVSSGISTSPTGEEPRPPSGTSPTDAETFYRSARFVYDVPANVADALKDAERSSTLSLDKLHDLTGEEVLCEYNNGPRTLRSDKICVLKVWRVRDPRQPDAQKDANGPMGKYAMLWASAHFALDGLATFVLLNEFFELLGGSSPSTLSSKVATAAKSSKPSVISTPDLGRLLEFEVQARRRHAEQVLNTPSRQGNWAVITEQAVLPFNEAIPPPVDSRIPPFKSEEDAKKTRASFDSFEKKFIGAHTFPRKPRSPGRSPSEGHTFEHPIHRSPSEPQRDHISRHVLYSPPQLARIIKACKKRGVSLQNAIFAACNIGWLRVWNEMKGVNEKEREKGKWPTLMYTAVNLRPFLPSASVSSTAEGAQTPIPSREPSIGYLGLGYFNVMLPGTVTLPTSSLSSSSSHSSKVEKAREEFWERARSAKLQQNEALQHPDILPRNVFQGRDRSARSVRFAIEDDGLAPPPPPPSSPSNSSNISSKSAQPTPPPPPSAALLGLSLMGSIDPSFKTSNYPLIQPLTLRAGTRKGAGGLVLSTYTFRGMFYLSVAWDEVPFVPGTVERFFESVKGVVGEMLLQDEADDGMEGKEGKEGILLGTDLRESDTLLERWIGPKPSLGRAVEKARL